MTSLKDKKVYITKHFLAIGIMELDLISGPDPTGKWIWCKSIEGSHVRVSKPDWHIDKSDAIARAREMIESRIASLFRQVNKLNELSKMTDIDILLYPQKGGKEK